MKIALGIVIGGAILWGLLELYVRYQVNQFAESIEHVAVQVESDLNGHLRRSHELAVARRAQQEQVHLEKTRKAAAIQARADQEKARLSEQVRMEAAWNAYY